MVNTEQLFKGKVLEEKRIWRVKMKDEEKLRNQEKSGEKELTTVEVHGLPVARRVHRKKRSHPFSKEKERWRRSKESRDVGRWKGNGDL